jgi:hypothetical protein
MANKRGAVLQRAIDECERFLRAAKSYDSSFPSNPGRLRAAAKRASLDASNAMTVLRNAYSHDWDADR